MLLGNGASQNKCMTSLCSQNNYVRLHLDSLASHPRASCITWRHPPSGKQHFPWKCGRQTGQLPDVIKLQGASHEGGNSNVCSVHQNTADLTRWSVQGLCHSPVAQLVIDLCWFIHCAGAGMAPFWQKEIHFVWIPLMATNNIIKHVTFHSAYNYIMVNIA